MPAPTVVKAPGFKIQLTGAPDSVVDVDLACSSLVFRQNGTSASIQVTIPATTAMVEAINARPNGEIVLQVGTYQSGAFVLSHTLATAVLDEVRDDKGAGSKTITLSCYFTDLVSGTNTVNVAGLSYQSTTVTARRWRLPYINGLKVGDIVDDNGDQLIVDGFSLYLKPGLSQFEVAGA